MIRCRSPISELSSSIALACSVMFSSLDVNADDFDVALRAYEDESYIVSLEAFKVLGAKGDKRAQTYVGTIYAEGLGVEEDNDTAFRWFELAAIQKYAEAQYGLGMLHLSGQIDEANTETALQWLRLAARQNHRESQALLGAAHYLGEGADQSFEEALYWLSLASDQEEPHAQKMLGDMYRLGNGVDLDIDMAREKYSLAAASGLDTAAEALAQIDRPFIRLIQEALGQLAYYDSSIDGEFGRGTQRAVKLFSEDLGLELDSSDKPKLLRAIEQRVADPQGQCGPVRQTYAACFSIR